MKLNKLISLSVISLCLSGGLLTGCGSSAPDNAIEAPAALPPEAVTEVASTEEVAPKEDQKTEEPAHGSRSNTPEVLVPTSDGLQTFGNDQVTVDTSNVSDGYFIIDYEGANDKPKMQIIGPQGLTYNFDVHKGPETYNFTQGNGTYQIGVYEHIGNSQYTALASATVEVTIGNEFSPYLYPNQYVYFTKDSNAVSMAEDLALTADTDLDVVANVYNYVINTISYDRELAQNVKTTYLPDPDRTLDLKTGICFDYASLMTAMLRSQRIPTRLEVGYSGDAYHAWISTYIEDIGWVNGIVQFHGDNWELMDPTLASTTSERELRSYIGDGSKYVVCYEY